MKPILLAVLVCLTLAQPATAADRDPGTQWTRVSAAEAGWSEYGLSLARNWSHSINSTAVMVIHHGVIVAQWGDTSTPTELASVRKSLLSALIGIAVQQRKISLDSTLTQLGIDDNPPSLTDTEKQATVRMLLEARSGIYHPALYETPAMAAARPPRGSHPPGTFWYYNNWDFNALGTIYERATGLGIYDAIDQQIARPIGMQDYHPTDGHYVTGPASIHRAYPLRMSARDLARFALLYLHNGAWNGHQIVPAAWVRDSTQSYADAGPGRGYGYLWWTAAPGGSAEAGGSLPKGTFFALGYGGQYAFVIPSDDLIVVNRVDLDQNVPRPSRAGITALLNLILSAGNLPPG